MNQRREDGAARADQGRHDGVGKREHRSIIRDRPGEESGAGCAP
jgi:hypothetical protein